MHKRVFFFILNAKVWLWCSYASRWFKSTKRVETLFHRFEIDSADRVKNETLNFFAKNYSSINVSFLSFSFSHIVICKVSRIQSIPQNQNKFQHKKFSWGQIKYRKKKCKKKILITNCLAYYFGVLRANNVCCFLF